MSTPLIGNGGEPSWRPQERCDFCGGEPRPCYHVNRPGTLGPFTICTRCIALALNAAHDEYADDIRNWREVEPSSRRRGT